MPTAPAHSAPPWTPALFLLSGCASATTTEAFRTAHDHFAKRAAAHAPVTLIASHLPDGRIHNEAGELSLDQVALDSIVPIPQSRDSFFLVGALADAKHIDFEDVPVLADDTLYRYALRIGYGVFLDDDLSIQGYWQPGVNSDLDGTLNSADWRLAYGRALAVWRATPDLFWKAGILSTDAVDTGVLPLLGVTWHFAEQWSLQTLLPRNCDLVWTDGGDWRAFLGVLIEADEYHVRSPASLGLQDDVHVQEVLAHVTVERTLAGGASMLVRTGTSIAGNWNYGYGDGTDDLTGTLEPDWFVAAGLTWRF